MIYGILHEHVVVTHTSPSPPLLPTRHCHRCRCPRVTITAAIAHASPLPLPLPACRCCHHHRCHHCHLCINITEKGPRYCPNTRLRCRKAHCVAQSQHMFQTKKKKGLTTLSNKWITRPRKATSTKANTIPANAHCAQVDLSPMLAKKSRMEIATTSFALINVNTAKMKENKDAPGSLLDCKLACLLHQVKHNSNSISLHPGECPCHDDAG